MHAGAVSREEGGSTNWELSLEISGPKDKQRIDEKVKKYKIATS